MRVFDTIVTYAMRELVERVYPFLMFLFFSLSLVRSVPMEWLLQKVKSLVLKVLALIFLIGLYQDVKAQQADLPYMGGDAPALQIPDFELLDKELVVSRVTTRTRFESVPKGGYRF